MSVSLAAKGRRYPVIIVNPLPYDPGRLLWLGVNPNAIAATYKLEKDEWKDLLKGASYRSIDALVTDLHKIRVMLGFSGYWSERKILSDQYPEVSFVLTKLAA